MLRGGARSGGGKRLLLVELNEHVIQRHMKTISGVPFQAGGRGTEHGQTNGFADGHEVQKPLNTITDVNLLLQKESCDHSEERERDAAPDRASR